MSLSSFVRDLQNHRGDGFCAADPQCGCAADEPCKFDNSKVVVLCGSARFSTQIRVLERVESLAGNIVLAPAFGAPVSEQERALLDALHLRKIDLADEVVVWVGPDGYIGKTTAREIAHASSTGKAVRFV